MEFSLLNKEPQTKNIIKELKKFGFKKINIDKKSYLSFIEIEDENFKSYITRTFFEDKLQYCLHIYKIFAYGNSINIPLSIIESVNEL